MKKSTLDGYIDTGHRTAEDVMTVVEAAIERKRGRMQ